MPDDRDDDLIVLCDRLIAAARDMWTESPETGDVDCDPAAEAEFNAMRDALADMRPVTPRGAIAMARAALARVPRGADGDPAVDDGADGMLVRVATWLAGSDLLHDSFVSPIAHQSDDG